MLVSVFCGMSVDGFIARKDGTFEFLDEGGAEPHGYDEFIKTIDTHVIGRNTYEVVLGFGEWAYGNKRVVVLSSKPLDFSAVREGKVEQMSGEPQEIIARLASSGAKHLYVDGGDTVQRFLRAGCVDRITVSRVPVLIGEGIPLFGSLPSDVKLRHIATTSYKTGLVKSEYSIEKATSPASAK